MNELEIDNILFYHPCTRDLFLGTFPIDRLPSHPEKPYALVINYDESHQDGSHWVCVYSDRNENHFHDSFGISPLKIEIPSFFEPEPYTCSIKQLQHKRSSTCGHHVIAYLISRACGMSTRKFLSLFGDDKRENDVAVLNFVRKIVNKTA